MAQPTEFDPVAAWQSFVSQWERQINEISAKVSGSEEFAGPMNHATKLLLAARQSSEGAMEKFAQALQLATSAQMQAVIERLDRIEQQLAQIAAALPNQRDAKAKPAPAPKRTRKPPGEAT